MTNLKENLDLSFDPQSYNPFIISLGFDVGYKLKEESNCLEQSSIGNNLGIGNFSVNSEQNDFIFDNDPQQNKKVDEYSEHELSEKKNTPKFTTKKKRNRGKKSTKNKRLKTHTKYDSDNIDNKIKTHFLNFLIFFANDFIRFILKENRKEKLFSRIVKKNINLKKNIYANFYYKDILTKLNASQNHGIKKNNKNYKKEKITNEDKYKYFCEKFPFLNDFFEQKVSDVFEKYYCVNKKEINKIKIDDNDDYEFELSSETETFYNLLDKNVKIEKNLIERKNKLVKSYKNIF